MAEAKQPTAIVVATQSKHLASHIERKAKCGGLSVVSVEPTAEAILARVSESQRCIVIVDAMQKGADALAIVKVLAESRPEAKAVILGSKPDLELVARSIVAGACQFLLENTPADEFATALTDLVAGKQLKEETLFGRVFASLPMPGGQDGWLRTGSGRRLSAEDAIKLCDQYGFSVPDIAGYLNVPISDVEQVTKKTRKVVKPSLLAEVLASLVPSDSIGMPYRRAMFAGLTMLVSLVVAVRLLSRETRRHLIAGEVTYQGKPVPAGIIRFTPQGQAESAGAIVAGAIREGRYKVRSGHGSDGGSYKVQISGFTGIPKQASAMMDPLGDPLFADVTRTAEVPCSDYTFNVKCD